MVARQLPLPVVAGRVPTLTRPAAMRTENLLKGVWRLLRVRVLQMFIATDYMDGSQKMTVLMNEEFPHVSSVHFPQGDENVVFEYGGQRWYAHCEASPNPFWEVVGDD